MAGCFVTTRSTQWGPARDTPIYYDRQMDEKILQRSKEDAAKIMEGTPSTLTRTEQELDVYALTKPPKPVPVSAWVRYGAIPLKVEAHAVAWTPKAAAVEWTTPVGDVHRAWVWSSAIA